MTSLSIDMTDSATINIHRVEKALFNIIVDRYDLETRETTNSIVTSINLGGATITLFHYKDGDNKHVNNLEAKINEILGLPINTPEMEEEDED